MSPYKSARQKDHFSNIPHPNTHDLLKKIRVTIKINNGSGNDTSIIIYKDDDCKQDYKNSFYFFSSKDYAGSRCKEKNQQK